MHQTTSYLVYAIMFYFYFKISCLAIQGVISGNHRAFLQLHHKIRYNERNLLQVIYRRGNDQRWHSKLV